MKVSWTSWNLGKFCTFPRRRPPKPPIFLRNYRWLDTGGQSWPFEPPKPIFWWNLPNCGILGMDLVNFPKILVRARPTLLSHLFFSICLEMHFFWKTTWDFHEKWKFLKILWKTRKNPARVEFGTENHSFRTLHEVVVKQSSNQCFFDQKPETSTFYGKSWIFMKILKIYEIFRNFRKIKIRRGAQGGCEKAKIRLQIVL